MKKLSLLFLAVWLTSSTLMFADDIFNINDIVGQAKTNAETMLTPVAKIAASSLNAGTFAPTSGKLFSVGLQFNGALLPNEGVLTNVSLSIVPVPYLYAGIRIPIARVHLMGRGVLFPLGNGTNITIIGLGAGWEPKLPIPLLSTKIMLNYSFVANTPMLPTISSVYPNVLVNLKLPFIKPYVNIGYSINKITTDITFPGDSDPFGIGKNYLHLGVGAKIFFFTLEANLLPTFSGSLSAGFSL